MSVRIKAAILKNETDTDHLEWVAACEDFSEKVEYTVIDLTAVDWLEAISDETINVFLAIPPDQVGYYKQLYDERLYVLNEVRRRPSMTLDWPDNLPQPARCH